MEQRRAAGLIRLVAQDDNHLVGSRCGKLPRLGCGKYRQGRHGWQHLGGSAWDRL